MALAPSAAGAGAAGVGGPLRGRGAEVLFWVLRLGFGGLFGLAGALKLGDPTAFATEIHNYQLLPALAPALAATLPAIEITLGAAMILGRRPWVRAGALAATALLVVFTVAVASVVVRGVDVACGCFGGGSGAVTLGTVLRDVGLVAAGVVLFRLAAAPRCVGHGKIEAEPTVRR